MAQGHCTSRASPPPAVGNSRYPQPGYTEDGGSTALGRKKKQKRKKQEQTKRKKSKRKTKTKKMSTTSMVTTTNMVVEVEVVAVILGARKVDCSKASVHKT